MARTNINRGETMGLFVTNRKQADSAKEYVYEAIKKGERLIEEHLHEGDAGLQRLKDFCLSYFKLESV